jgi:hypothetical protein
VRLAGSFWVNVEQAAENDEVWLMKNKRRRFPKVVIKALLQVVLGGAEDGSK